MLKVIKLTVKNKQVMQNQTMFLVSLPTSNFITANVDTARTAITEAIQNWNDDQPWKELTHSNWGDENRIWERWTAIDSYHGTPRMEMEIQEIQVR